VQSSTALYPINDLVASLNRILGDEGSPRLVRTDLTTRLLYSTDASIYQVEPLGVVFPRRLDDLQAIMETCAAYSVPVLARGSGSSLAGQAIGPAMIVDCSRFLNRLIEINPEAGTATVEPGLILNALNRSAAERGLQFGPDPASSERATMGGCIANNASGAHSILYGMTADHVLSAQVILADGSQAVFEEVKLDDVEKKLRVEGRNGEGGAGNVPDRASSVRTGITSLEAAIYREALDIRERYGEIIRRDWPRTWRNASGYAINYLLPWSPSKPPQWEGWGGGVRPVAYPPVSPNAINLAPLLAGSEGTLAIIKQATLQLVALPKHTILGVLAFPGIAEACATVPDLLERGPSAVELIPQDLIRLARSVPAYAKQLGFLDQLSPGRIDPPAILVVEFTGDSPEKIKERASSLRDDVLVAETAETQRQVWAVRKVGLGLLMSRAGDVKPWPFIEDLSVPVDRLGEFVREMQHILESHNVEANFYGHASAGCLHIRPMVDLKSVQGLAMMRLISAQAVDLTVSLGGSVSGEHGDGLSRSGWLEWEYGKEIIAAFGELKNAADPHGLLNPGKIVPVQNSKPVALDENLRFGSDYRIAGWKTVFDFSSQAGLVGAIEQCNGAGVCRKVDGVMCPSFQATQEEMHSTRGRANLLRAMVTGRFKSQGMAEKTLYEALDLCLACKGCKAECPSSVDMAKLKYEFLNAYYENHPRKLRDYIFAYIGTLGYLGSPFAGAVNLLLADPTMRKAGENLLGLASQRPFPRFAKRSLHSLVSKNRLAGDDNPEKVLFLTDAFTEYFNPQVGLAALHVLYAVGCEVKLIPVIGAGRTLISKGFLKAAKRHAQKVVEVINRLDPNGEIPIVGVEPSEIVTLRDEYLDLLPGDKNVRMQSSRTFMIDEFLMRPTRYTENNVLRIAKIHQKSSKTPKPKILLHGHCYQKTQALKPDQYPSGIQATATMLSAIGYQVELIESGCCGVAGAFGYEAEHYELSMKIGDAALLPAVRRSGEDVIIAASGVSCQAQIQDGTGRPTFHPIQLVEKLII
jgi:FAD/FMN-containing dehydrogenase/Fe-S oxidoreductase